MKGGGAQQYYVRYVVQGTFPVDADLAAHAHTHRARTTAARGPGRERSASRTVPRTPPFPPPPLPVVERGGGASVLRTPRPRCRWRPSLRLLFRLHLRPLLLPRLLHHLLLPKTSWSNPSSSTPTCCSAMQSRRLPHRSVKAPPTCLTPTCSACPFVFPPTPRTRGST